VNKQLTAATAGIAGAIGMYLLDPIFGKRRRGHLMDKALHFSKLTARGFNVIARDTSHRIHGAVAASSRTFSTDHVDDDILIERVRSALGRAISHPHSIEVHAKDGWVTLAGPVPVNEHKHLLDYAQKVRGVQFVEDQLEPDQETRGIRRGQLMQTNWPPAARAFATLAGMAGLLFGATRRNIRGTLIAGAGATLMARGITNLEMKRLVGIGAGRRAVDLQKTIHINAPVERVYSMWSLYENFPFFMSGVRDVRDLGRGRSHWVVSGPANTTAEWDAVITQNVPNRVIAWKTEPGALVANAGIVRFDPERNGTRVQIRFSYNPPGGAAGHSIAWLIGADPRKRFDHDLVRMKSFIETGVQPHDAAGRRVG
jgi:uncharacterized membrane protein